MRGLPRAAPNRNPQPDMKLDSLYSELTLKTNAKLALIVLDGLGDIARKETN